MPTSALSLAHSLALCCALATGPHAPSPCPDHAQRAARELVLLEEPEASSVLCLLALPALSAGEGAVWSAADLDRSDPEGAGARIGRISLELAPGAVLLGFECAPQELEAALGTLWRELAQPAASSAPALPAPDSARTWRALVGARTAPLLRLPPADSSTDQAAALRTLLGRIDPRSARIALAGPGLEARRERIRALVASPPPAAEPGSPPPSAPASGLFVRDRAGEVAAELWLRCAPPVEEREREALRVGLEALLGAGGGDRLRSALSAGPAAGFADGILLAEGAELQAWGQAPVAELAQALAALKGGWLAAVDALDEAGIARARERLDAAARSTERSARLRRALMDAPDAPRSEPAPGAPTSEQVRAALRGILAPERRVLLAIGPAPELERALAALGPARRVDALGDGDAGPALARIFEALGGREAWASARYVEIESVHHQAPHPPARLRTLRDLDAARMRVEREAGGQSSTLVLWEGGAASRTGNFVQEIGASTRADLERRSWREIACLLHQLAAQGELVARAAGKDRIELRSGPARGLWIELGTNGLPERAGAQEPDGGSILLEFADWRRFGDLLAPSRVAMQPDGWRRELLSLRLHEAVDEARFQRP